MQTPIYIAKKRAYGIRMYGFCVLLWAITGPPAQASTRDSLLLQLQAALPDTARVMRLVDLAGIYRRSSPDSATMCLHQAYQLAVEADYPQGQLRALNGLGITLMQYGAREDAIRNFLAALKIAEKYNYSESKAPLLGNIGTLYDELQDGPNALYYHRQALSMARREGKRQYVANTLNNLGTVWLETYHQTDSAQWYFRQACQLKKQIKDSIGIVSSLNNMARSFIYIKKTDSARWYLDNALAIEAQTCNRKAETSTRLRLAELFLQQGVLDSARLQALSALALSQLLKTNLLQIDAYALLAQIAQATGDLQHATTYLTQQMALQDSLARADLRAKARNLEQDLRLQQELSTLNSDTRRQKLLLAIMASALFLLGLMGAGMVRLIRSRNKAIRRLHQAQDNLQALTRELEHRVTERTAVLASRTAQLEAYAHHTSHRLRAPLTTLLGLVEVFRLFPQPPEAQPYLDGIEATTYALDGVVHDIQHSLNDVSSYNDPPETKQTAAD